VFHNEDGTPYIPLNFRGEWKGSVLLYDALAHSMNVASLKILDTIGFDAAIDRSAALLNITDPAQIRRNFPRVYPLGLGIISASPLRMARAFAVFGNQGRSVTPISIRSVEDRNGRVVLDVERDLRQQQRRMGNSIQVISPQNAFIMSRILEKTVEEGSLANGAGWGAKFTFRDENGRAFRMPVAGKTGTPQNWSDAWAIGYSPYYTTAVWFGFDKPGNSLGVELTGSTLSGPVWGDFMREVHRGLPYRDFPRPASGLIDVTVCATSGLLKIPACNEGEVTFPLLEGTQPTQHCNIHGNSSYYPSRTSSSIIPLGRFEDDALLGSLSMPALDFDLLPELRDEQPAQTRTQNNHRNMSSSGRNTNQSRLSPPPVWSFNNPLLDDNVQTTPVIPQPEQDTHPSLPSSFRQDLPVTENSEFAQPHPIDTSSHSPPETEKFNTTEIIAPQPGSVEDTDNGSGLPSWNPLE
jgi:penicillin-binding protein 1A